MKRIAFCALGCAAIATFASAQSSSGDLIGPKVGVFLPASSTLRDAIGSQWLSFGLGTIDPQTATGNNNYDINFITGSGNGNKVFIGTYTYNFLQSAAKAKPRAKNDFLPYFALRGGLAYMDYAVNTSPANRESNKAFGLNGNAEIGVLLNKNLSLSARYDLFTQRDGLQFDGLTLAIKYGISTF